MGSWRTGCVETRTSGSEGGPRKRASRKTGTAPRSDPTSTCSSGASSAGSSTPSICTTCPGARERRDRLGLVLPAARARARAAELRVLEHLLKPLGRPRALFLLGRRRAGSGRAAGGCPAAVSEDPAARGVHKLDLPLQNADCASAAGVTRIRDGSRRKTERLTVATRRVCRPRRAWPASPRCAWRPCQTRSTAASAAILQPRRSTVYLTDDESLRFP